MQPTSQTPMDHAVDLPIVGIVFLVIGLFYVLPASWHFVVINPNRWFILVTNLAFGGTIIGWGISLAWAMCAIHRLGSSSSGGESGLNLFVNDVRKVQVLDPTLLPRTSVTLELERLHGLFVRGTISQIEFDGSKAKLLGTTP
jgi:hypothetical protein